MPQSNMPSTSTQSPVIASSPTFTSDSHVVLDAVTQSDNTGGDIDEHGWRSPALALPDDEGIFTTLSGGAACDAHPAATPPSGSDSSTVIDVTHSMMCSPTPLSFSGRKRQRAPAPGNIDLSFLSTNPKHSPASSNSGVIPSRPPRPKPTPALSAIVTPAAGWFTPNLAATLASSLGYVPLAQEVDGESRSSASSSLPPAPVGGTVSFGYFAASVPKADSSKASPSQFPISTTPGVLHPNPLLLTVERPKLLRSRFSSAEHGGAESSEVCQAVAGQQHDTDEELHLDEDETERSGDGWARANMTRKRVLLEWEANRAGHGPCSASSRTSQFTTCSVSTPQSRRSNASTSPASSITTPLSASSQIQRNLAVPPRPSFARSKSSPTGTSRAPLGCSNGVFASSPLAGKPIVPVVTSCGSPGSWLAANFDESDALHTPSRPPNMRRSSHGSLASPTASPVRKSLPKAPAWSSVVPTSRLTIRNSYICKTERFSEPVKHGLAAPTTLATGRPSKGLSSGYSSSSDTSDGLSISIGGCSSNYDDLPDSPRHSRFASPWGQLVAESLASFTPPPLVPIPAGDQPPSEARGERDDLWEAKMSGYFASMVA